MLTISIAYTFIHDIFYYFSFVGLSLYFYLFADDVACSILLLAKIKRILATHFHLREGRYMATFEWMIICSNKTDQSWPFM